MTSIAPGQPVLTLALPIPVDGISLIADVVERLYGAGESTLHYGPNGTTITISAPADGFKPRVRSALPKLELPKPAAADGMLRSAVADGDGLTLTLEESTNVVTVLSAALARWFELNGGINYVTATLVSDTHPEAAFTTTVRRADAPTPEQLHLTALTRVDALERQLRELGVEPC